MTPTFALEARDLTVNLGGKQVIDVPSLGVSPNETLVIIGPNGSGKTTLLLSMALLLKPEKGQIIFRGEPVTDGPQALKLRRQFAVVFQEALLLDGSVWDNVTLGLRLRGAPKQEISGRAQKWLERFGIASLSKRQAKTLSGGEAKRVSLARAFILEPEILFLDEPFAALDTPTHQAILEDFQSVLRETRTSTVMVTHDHDEALMIGDRVAVLVNGHVRQVGTPQEVFSTPADAEVAGFVKAGNVLQGVVTAQNGGLVLVTAGGRQLEAVSPLPSGTAVTVYLNYEDITVSAETMRSSARNHLKGKISRITPLGSQVRVTVDCPPPLAALITKRSYDEMGLAVGREVVATFKASSVRLLPRHG